MGDPGPLGPFGGDDPFKGMPFLGDLAKLIQNQGPVSWDAARQLAYTIANGGQSEPNVDPMERMKLEQLGRVADLHVAKATGLSTSITDRGVTITPTTRAGWVQRSVDAYRPRFERLAGSIGGGSAHPGDEGGLDDPAEAGDPMGAWLGGLMQMLGPMMLGMTAGSMIGHLARRSLGQYDLPVPRPPSDELLVVVANLDELGAEWSLPPDDLRLWVCLHEVAHHAVLAVPHVRARLDDLLDRHLSSFEADPAAFEHRLGEIDPSDPTSMQGFQDLLGDPQLLLGAVQSPAQRELLPQIAALVAVIEGYVDHVMDTVGTGLITSYGMVTEAMRRRRVTADQSDRFVERLFGMELTQEQYDRGSAFVAGVIERAGSDGLERLWASAVELPTPAEVDAPGLWLARIDLPA